LSLATADLKNNPWVSPVLYSFDKDWNFYFVSIPGSKHGTLIKNNKQVAAVIYDSRQLFGQAAGLYIEGTVRELPLKEFPAAAAIVFKRKYPYGGWNRTFEQIFNRFMQRKLYHFYKITPTKTWVNDPDSEIDERVEVKL
jgi:uncharacterized protein YhbP (UPF0306 family)